MKKSGTDLAFAVGWVGFGAAVLAASWRMDRLEHLHINPWSAPGLMPGVLGALMIVFGAALGWRALRQRTTQAEGNAASIPRILLAIGLCVAYAAGLLGHGVSFWLSSSAFLFVSVLSFRWLDRDAVSPPLARLAASSAVIALGASLAIGFLFEQVFFVRLP
ncbi:MAG TPA: tripartite tricarboxylate transporter TctB family protein [Burkholderiales bacterium]|nr:tripartite tricarboxylate transporter TctB family protein [Burkholderiales bacterium]